MPAHFARAGMRRSSSHSTSSARASARTARRSRSRFSLAFAATAARPTSRFFTCQQHYPENFWNPAFQTARQRRRPASPASSLVADDAGATIATFCRPSPAQRQLATSSAASRIDDAARRDRGASTPPRSATASASRPPDASQRRAGSRRSASPCATSSAARSARAGRISPSATVATRLMVGPDAAHGRNPGIRAALDR